MPFASLFDRPTSTAGYADGGDVSEAAGDSRGVPVAGRADGTVVFAKGGSDCEAELGNILDIFYKWDLY